MTEGNARLVTNESEGPIATGGDLTLGGTCNVAIHSAGGEDEGHEATALASGPGRGQAGWRGRWSRIPIRLSLAAI